MKLNVKIKVTFDGEVDQKQGYLLQDVQFIIKKNHSIEFT